MPAILGNTPTLEAENKKATVIVTVENFRPDEKKLEYKVYKSGTQELLGKKIFAANKIETDEPDFSLYIKYDARGCMKGVEWIFVFTGCHLRRALTATMV